MGKTPLNLVAEVVDTGLDMSWLLHKPVVLLKEQVEVLAGDIKLAAQNAGAIFAADASKVVVQRAMPPVATGPMQVASGVGQAGSVWTMQGAMQDTRGVDSAGGGVGVQGMVSRKSWWV